MISCKGCPFLYEEEYDEMFFLCNLNYEVISPPLKAGVAPNFDKATSENCKLEAITYSLSTERDSIDFIPKEIK